jgi:excisionase family DNA binding protein
MDLPKSDQDPLWTKGQLAEYFQVTSRTIDGWMRTGKIPYFKISRTVRFRLADVLRQLNQSHRIN